MVLRVLEPGIGLRRMHHHMDRLWRGVPVPVEAQVTGKWSIALDAIEEDDKLVLRATLPGVNPDDINVTIEDRVLTIDAKTGEEHERKEGNYLMRERRTGSFHRSLRLPDTVDVDNAAPTYDEGVLTISFPKAESKRAKHLTVTTGKELEANKK